jgi:hypothetical protein
MHPPVIESAPSPACRPYPDVERNRTAGTGLTRRALGLVVLALASAGPAAAQRLSTPGPTTLVVLGVDHSAQLGNPAYHSGYFRAFFDHERVEGWRDFPRRLDLYRTFMQAMRIRAAATAHRGDTVLVVVGSMHKDDLEHILGGDPGIRIVQPSSYGVPTAAEADARLERSDLAAILSFNLLGVQPSLGPVDRAWVGEVLDRYAREDPGSAALPLLRERYRILTGSVAPAAAAADYERIASRTDSTARFEFTGVEDRRRVDSYFDPFGNLGVRARTLLEAAREWARAGRDGRVQRLREEIARGLPPGPLAEGEFDVYWERYLVVPVGSGVRGPTGVRGGIDAITIQPEAGPGDIRRHIEARFRRAPAPHA